jgi:hypothetical protein
MLLQKKGKDIIYCFNKECNYQEEQEKQEDEDEDTGVDQGS